MTKYEWETELRKCMHRLPKVEQDRVIEYYNELFADQAENGRSEKQIINEFGNPSDVAFKIMTDYGMDVRPEESDRPIAPPEFYSPARPVITPPDFWDGSRSDSRRQRGQRYQKDGPDGLGPRGEQTRPLSYSDERRGDRDYRGERLSDRDYRGEGRSERDYRDERRRDERAYRDECRRSDRSQRDERAGRKGAKKRGCVSSVVFIIELLIFGGLFVGVAAVIWSLAVSALATGYACLGGAVYALISAFVPPVEMGVRIVTLAGSALFMAIALFVVPNTVRIVKGGASLTKKSWNLFFGWYTKKREAK